MKLDNSHVGSAALYTGRNGNTRRGIIQGFTGPDSGRFVDLKLDNSAREHFYVPEDAIVLVPDELGDILGS